MQRIEGIAAGPDGVALQDLRLELALVQVGLQEVLHAEAVLPLGELLGVSARFAVEEVESRHGQGGCGPAAEGGDLPFGIHLGGDGIRRIILLFAEHAGADELPHGLGQELVHALAAEYVVAEDERDRIVAYEFLRSKEGVGDSLLLLLDSVFDGDAELLPVLQELLVIGSLRPAHDYEDIPDPGVHERGQGVVYHGLVVDRKKILRHRHGGRIQTSALASGKDDSLHPPLDG